jgi:hypothetical protein
MELTFLKKDGLVSLTDIFKQAEANGLTDGKRDPRRWKDEAGADFIAAIAGALNVPAADIMKSTRGKGGGTYAHWQIALAYAKYLSPILHMQVNEVYARFQKADISLAGDIADRATPEDAKRLAARVNGVVVRNEFTAALAKHGVTGNGYKECTNAIYMPLFNGTAKQIRESRNLPEKANVREHMSSRELVMTAFAELLATEKIEASDSYGNTSCVHICNKSGKTVSDQVIRARIK